MDINFSPEDMAFQEEVRAWFKAHTPPDLNARGTHEHGTDQD